MSLQHHSVFGTETSEFRYTHNLTVSLFSIFSLHHKSTYVKPAERLLRFFPSWRLCVVCRIHTERTGNTGTTFTALTASQISSPPLPLSSPAAGKVRVVTVGKLAPLFLSVSPPLLTSRVPVCASSAPLTRPRLSLHLQCVSVRVAAPIRAVFPCSRHSTHAHAPHAHAPHAPAQ